MKNFLYSIVSFIASCHSYLMELNDSYEYNFSDKQLHFLIIGVIGMAALLIIYPLFKYLAWRKRILTIAFIYVFTLIIVLTFAIEIGQKVSGTGSMDFADIVSGVIGFLLMYAIFAIIHKILSFIRSLIKA